MKYFFQKHFPSLNSFLVELRTPSRGYGRKSFSQFGEDIVLSTFLKKESGFYVDVGAYNPIKYSNTYLFYRKGWGGINIDARPGSMKDFKKMRGRDINLEIGISKDGQASKFYMFEEPAYNTFSEIKVKKCIAFGIEPKASQIIQTDRLENILDKHLPKGTAIDFLNIDAEGMDMCVLQSNDWLKYSPAYVLVEAHNTCLEDILNSEIYIFMLSKQYKLISIVYITLIFKYEPKF